MIGFIRHRRVGGREGGGGVRPYRSRSRGVCVCVRARVRVMVCMLFACVGREAVERVALGRRHQLDVLGHHLADEQGEGGLNETINAS